MRQLLVSGPGTGKTTRCIELFQEEIARSRSGIDSRSYFVLPSREHAERIQHLILKKDVPGLFNAHILTLNELAAKLAGFSSAGSPSDAVRRRIIREVLHGGTAFDYFGASRDLAGFHELLADLIKEFESSLLSLSEFEKLAQPLLKDAAFRSKFRDFTVLVQNYSERLAEAGLAEPESNIRRLQRSAAAPGSMELVVFDGFYHFSRAQRQLIRHTAEAARRTVVTLTLADDADSRPDLFYHASHTRAFLEGIGFKATRPGDGRNHRTASPTLRQLERALFAPGAEPSALVPDALTILEAPDARGEMEMIAREIRDLVRREPLYLSDIAVILRAVSPYQKLIASVFEELGVPVHIHERYALTDTRLGAHFYRLIRLLGDTANAEERAAVLSTAAAGGRHPEAVEKLESDMRSCAGAAAFSAAFNRYLGTLRPADGPAEKQAERTLREILRQTEPFAETSSKRAFDARARLAELETVVGQALFSLKGRGKNRVQVYDAVMALPKEYKTVFIAGLVERQFPAALSEEAVFKDQERAVLNRDGVVLEERRTRAAGERYFFYMAVARARERLYFSYPLYDADKRPVLASFFVEEVSRCFSGPIRKRTRQPEAYLPEPAEWETVSDLLRGFGRALPSSPERAVALGEFLSGRGLPPERLAAVSRYARTAETDAEIRDPRIRAAFAADRKPFSPSRLEMLAACRFRYFAAEALQLKEPLDGREAMETGNILHRTLQLYYESLDAAALKSGRYLQDTDAMFKGLRETLGPVAEANVLAQGPRYRFRGILYRMERALRLFCETEKKLAKARGFIPAHFELTFSDKKKAPLPPLSVGPASDPVTVRGQIDRIDVSRDGRDALVVDYKLSRRDIHKKLEKGLELQLPLYILAARRLLKLNVLGAEHRYLTEGEKAGLYREGHRRTLALHHKTAAYEETDFEGILERTERTVAELARQLRGADIAVRSKSCQYCRFMSVCRYETWRLAYE